MRRRTCLLLGAVAVVTLAGCGGGADAGATDVSVVEYKAGERPAAPEIGGELLDGSDYELADALGDVVVVNVWGSWCGPCRAETADLEKVHQATRDLGVSFVGIDIRDNRDSAIAFMEGRVTYPSIFDPGGRLLLGFDELPPIAGPPATLVVDREGRAAALIRRQLGRAELQQMVTRIANEAPGDG